MNTSNNPVAKVNNSNLPTSIPQSNFLAFQKGRTPITFYWTKEHIVKVDVDPNHKDPGNVIINEMTNTIIIATQRLQPSNDFFIRQSGGIKSQGELKDDCIKLMEHLGASSYSV